MASDLQVIKSTIEDKINILRKIPDEDCIKSNCHGTTLYLLDFEAGKLPSMIWPDEMVSFLENHCKQVEKPREADIATIWSKFRKDRITGEIRYWLEHSGIVVHPQTERIYHQRGTGQGFEFSTINDYISKELRGKKRDKNVFAGYFRYIN